MEVIFLEQNSIRVTISMVTTVSCQLIRHMLVNTDTMVMALDTSWGMALADHLAQGINIVGIQRHDIAVGVRSSI